MQRFRQMRSLQKFAAVHASVCNHFNPERSFYSRLHFKLNRAAALAELRSLGAAQAEAPQANLKLVHIALTCPSGFFQNRFDHLVALYLFRPAQF